MSEEKVVRRKHTYLNTQQVMSDLRRYLPENGEWKDLPVGAWAKSYGVHPNTLSRKLHSLTDSIEAESYSDKNAYQHTRFRLLKKEGNTDVASGRLTLASQEASHELKCVDVNTKREEGSFFVFTNIPNELKVMSRWAFSKQGKLKDDGRYDKPPLQISEESNYGYASINKPWQWVDYETAECAFIEAVRTWKIPPLGLAFALQESDGIVLADIDNCIHDGIIDAWAQEIIDSWNTYTEVSISGTGVHMLAHGTIPCNRNTGTIELYSSHFIMLTGHVVPGHGSIEQRQKQINASFPKYTQPSAFTLGICPISEDEVLEKAKKAQYTDDKFNRLWSGDTSGYRCDESRADAALCKLLAYWCDYDAAMIDSLYRKSGLYRDKWDEYHGYDECHNRLTYGEMTIRYALRGV